MTSSARTRAPSAVPLLVLAILFAAAAPPRAAPAQPRGTTGTPIGDWSDLRGTNYVVASATARNNVQMWLKPGANNGTFRAPIVDQEIGLLAQYGLNSIRVFGSFFAYAADRPDYLANLKTLLGLCVKHKIRVSFVVWDSFGVDGLEGPILGSPTHGGGTVALQIIQLVNTEMGRALKSKPSLPAGWGGMWFASPGNALLVRHQDPRLWPSTLRQMADGYLDDVARLFAKDFKDAYLSYDLINEPDNLFLTGRVNLPAMVQLATRLSAYSMDRILTLHPAARFTLGTVDAYAGILVHEKLKSLKKRGLDYLSYHDYLMGRDFDRRALQAAALGAIDKLEVVCSEYFTAARQGHLLHLLGSLDAAGIGGQMWGAIQDRIFVVRYDQAFGRVFPANPTRWWVNDTGVFRPVADTKSPTGWRYQAKNAVFARALRIWASNETPIVTHWPSLTATTPFPKQDPWLFKLTVRGPVGMPVNLLIGNARTQHTAFPGFGTKVLDGRTLTTVPMGWTLPTSTPGQGEVSIVTRIPPIVLAASLPVQAVLGNDYDLLNWEQSSRTLATALVLLP